MHIEFTFTQQDILEALAANVRMVDSYSKNDISVHFTDEDGNELPMKIAAIIHIDRPVMR